MTKAQKIVVLAAAGLILIAFLFPPYKEGEVDEKGELTGWHVKWAFNKNMRDLINPPYEIWEYATAPEIQCIEVFGIIVLAGAAFLIMNKK
jgi:hypothetical protein